jgi:hypothetical protein
MSLLTDFNAFFADRLRLRRTQVRCRTYRLASARGARTDFIAKPLDMTGLRLVVKAALAFRH